MVLLSGIRHARSFAGSLNALASTSLRLLVLWSNLLQFEQSSHWLSHVVGIFISWMSIMPFFTARCLKLSSVLSPLVSKTPLIQIMYVVSTALFMDSSKPLVHGTADLLLTFCSSVSLRPKQTRPCFSITRVHTWPIFFCMWMILCLLPPPCQHYDESSVPSSKNFLILADFISSACMFSTLPQASICPSISI
jgi:hypothetical protein